jgi:integrase
MRDTAFQIGDYWLSKRPGSNQWCRTWYCRDTRQTKRHSLGTADIREAREALAVWFAKYGKLTEQDPAITPVELVFSRYYEQHASKIASAEMARIALAYWLEFFAGRSVDALTPQEQRRFAKVLQDGGRSNGYIKRILTVGKAALGWAVKEGELRYSPPVISWEDGEPKDRVLTVDESRALWAAAHKPHERMYLALAFGTMSRPEAILELRRDMVDFDRRLIDTNPPGHKQTRKRRPVVPVPDFLLPMLADAPDGVLVQWKGQPIASFKTAFRRIRRDAGLGLDVVAKTIRHTMATELRTQDVPEAEIEGMLGHRAFKRTTGVYAKYRPDYLGEARVAVDAYMARVLESAC